MQSPPMVIAPASPDLHESVVALWRDAGLTRPWSDAQADLRALWPARLLRYW
jgi:hypothetical protein